MRRGRRDDDGSAGTGAGPGDEAHDTAPYGGPPAPDEQAGGRPPAAYGTYGQPLFGRPGYGQPGYGNNPYPPPDGTGAVPLGPPGPARGRPGLIVTIAFLVQLVLVAAVGNSWTSEHVVRRLYDHEGLVREFARIAGVLSWRFTPPFDAATRIWAAALIGLAALFVVAALLALVLVRGPITFWRAFVGVWLATLVGVLANGVVRRAINEPIGRTDRLTSALFYGGGTEIPAGVLLGLLAGLVAGIVAVVSRRPGVVPVGPPPPATEFGPDPEAPTPWYGDDARPAPEPHGTSPSMRKVQQSVGPADSQTQVFATERLPDVAPPAPRPAPPAADARPDPDAQATTQLPAAGAVTGSAARSDDATQAVPVVPAESAPSRDSAPPRESAPPRDSAPPRESAPPAGSDEPTAVRRPEGFPPPASAAEGQSTQRFPRPPDDEELGHHPD